MLDINHNQYKIILDSMSLSAPSIYVHKKKKLSYFKNP